MATEELAAGKSYDTKGMVNISVKISTANSDQPFKTPVLCEWSM